MAIGQSDFLEDGQVRALCTQCSAEKHEPFDRCEKCALKPVGDDLIKATAASVYRYFDQPSMSSDYAYELAAYRSKDLAPLLNSISDDEFDRMRQWLSDVTQAPALPTLAGKLVGKILPILLVAAIFGGLVAYLKH